MSCRAVRTTLPVLGGCLECSGQEHLLVLAPPRSTRFPALASSPVAQDKGKCKLECRSLLCFNYVRDSLKFLATPVQLPTAHKSRSSTMLIGRAA